MFHAAMQSINQTRLSYDIPLGVSMTASWAWGVSFAVGTSIISEKGILPFLIWALANSAALLLFGLFILKYPVFLSFSNFWYVKVPMVILQIFSIWINIKIMAHYTTINISIILTAIVFVLVWIYGFKASIKRNVIQFAVLVCALLTIIFIGDDPLKYNSLLITNNIDYISWAIVGGIGLISGPFIDGQQHQRALLAKNINPFLIGSLFFGLYMLLVLITSYYSTGFGWLLVAITVIGLATSTLEAATSALQNLTNTKSGIIISVLALLSWEIVKSPTIADFWFWYATKRIFIVIPLCLAAIWLSKQKR
jgi:hypothetical protein